MEKSKVAQIVSNKEFYFHILFWVFYFATINAIWTNNWFDRSLRSESISQFAIILFPLFFYFNAFYLIPKHLKQGKWFRYILSTSVIMIMTECVRIVLYLTFNGLEESLYISFVNEFKSYDNIIIGRLNPIIISFQFSLIYRFTRDWIFDDNLVDSLKEDLKLTLLFWLFFSPFVIFKTFLTHNDYVLNILYITSGTLLITLDVFFITYVLLPKLLFKKRYFSFFIAFTVTQFIVTLIQHIVLGNKGIFGVQNDFLIVLTDKTLENIKVMAILLGLLLSKKYYSSKNRLLKIEKEKNKNELKWLKSQVNPHFLFNNLNALDDLIDRNPKVAKDYVQKLSNIYRYILATAEENVVSLLDEWDFINDYIYLLEERYGNSYCFNKTNVLSNLEDYLIPPASLQSLIENAVKHNQGSLENPLVIDVDISFDKISVSHLKSLKIDTTNSLGTGLENLKSRYLLLTNKEIRIVNSNHFSVTLPLIKNLS